MFHWIGILIPERAEEAMWLPTVEDNESRGQDEYEGVFCFNTKSCSFTSQLSREQISLNIVITAVKELNRSGEASLRLLVLTLRPEWWEWAKQTKRSGRTSSSEETEDGRPTGRCFSWSMNGPQGSIRRIRWREASDGVSIGSRVLVLQCHLECGLEFVINYEGNK